MTANGRLELVADIGGTNARFALADPTSAQPRLLHAQSLANADYGSLQHAAEHYLDGVGFRPRRAAIALACPVDADEIRLTNRAWSFSREALRQSLGLDELHLLNDFGAVAWSVPALRDDDRVALYGPVPSRLQGPVSVLGPGTGFGVGLLVDAGDGHWQAVATEGGHVSFAPQDVEEEAIARWLQARHGRVSWERLLSGNGLASMDAVLRGTAEVPDPAVVVAAALAGQDRVSRQALAQFCAILGSVAGDVALIHGARTVMVAGGIVPRFVPFLRSSAFRERFLAKGRFAAYLESVAIQVITHPQPGLLGAAVALRRGGGNAAAAGAEYRRGKPPGTAR